MENNISLKPKKCGNCCFIYYHTNFIGYCSGECYYSLIHKQLDIFDKNTNYTIYRNSI